MKHSEYHTEIGVGERMGLPKSWAAKPVFRWAVRAVLAWTVTSLVIPVNLMACACSEMVLGSAAINSSLDVDSQNGILSLVQGDIELPGIVPVNLTRLYVGNDANFTMFGFGWEMQGLSYLRTTTGDIKIINNGTVETYTQAGGYYSSGETKKLTFVSGTEVKVVDQHGNEWHYSLTDRTLTYTKDANGNEVDYTWKIVTLPYDWMSPAPADDDIPRVYCPLTITYPDSRQITFTYSTASGYEYLCTQATSPSGFTVSYSYTNGLLTGIAKSNSQYLNYDYNTLVVHGKTEGWLKKITYASGAEVNITWNGNYQDVDNLHVMAVTGPLGYSHTFGYGTVTIGNQTVSQTTLTDSLGHATKYQYWPTGTTTPKAVVDALNYTQTSVLNAKNRLTSSTNKRGKTSSFTYDESNANPLSGDNMLSMTDPLGHTTQFAYDSSNNMTSVTDPLGRVTSMSYDSHENLLSLTNGLSQVAGNFTYTNQGLLASAKDGLGNETDFTYNTNGFLTKITDALSKEWTNTYDSAGNLLTSTTPLGRTMTYTYNGFYKVATMTDPLGHEAAFDYDDMANLTKVTDTLGHETNTTYDLLQRVTSVTDALSHMTTFAYDAETNLTKLTDALGHEYTYTFDAVNQTKTFGFPGGTSEGYDYDANGNLTKYTDRSGKTIDYAYDDADRLTTKTWNLGGGVTNVFAYTYNNADQLTGISLGGVAKVSYGYDGAARLTSMTSGGLTVEYGYDGAQNLSEVTYPSGTVADFVFDARGKLSQLKKDAGIITAYAYDDDGRLTKKQLGNGLEQVYGYDTDGRVTQIEVHEIATPTNVRQRFTYGYDAVGNRLYTKYLNGCGDVYNYDATYQLIGVKYDVDDPTVAYASATGASRTVTYSYDSVGNRISVVDGASTTTYSTNSLNQYTSVGGTNYTYDTKGQLTGDGTWTYGYDQEGHLVEAGKAGETVNYGYDVLGRRTSKTINGVTTHYVYSGQNLIEERDASGNVTKRYIYERGIDQPVQAVIGGSVYYFTQDALGSVIALTDASGVIVESYTYDVFGGPIIKDGFGMVLAYATTPFLFTGREYDSETGLYHYRTRAYSPSLGRFIQPDSIGFIGGDINIYRYAGNRSTQWGDSLGLCSEKDMERFLQFANPSEVDSLVDAGIEAFKNGGTAGLRGKFDDGGPRYAYSNYLGWIDLQHVSGSAAISSKYGAITGQIIGYGVEVNQVINGYINPVGWFTDVGAGARASAFAKEDLYSNAIGDVRGATGRMPTPMDFIDKEAAKQNCGCK